MDKQLSLSALSDELSQVRTKKREFLAEIDRIVPWEKWISIIKPYYYKGERGNKPYDLERMLRIYLVQNLYNLSDMAAVAEVIDSRAFSDFCGVESSNQIPDGDTIGKFRNLLIRNGIHEKFFAMVVKNLTDRGLILKKERSLIPPLFLPRLPLKIRRKSVIRTHTPLRKELRGTSAIKHTLAWIRIQVLSITWRLLLPMCMTWK